MIRYQARIRPLITAGASDEAIQQALLDYDPTVVTRTARVKLSPFEAAMQAVSKMSKEEQEKLLAAMEGVGRK